MPGKVRLIVTGGRMAGREWEFTEHDTFVCGRADDCHACLPDDDEISRHHFILEVNPPDACLRDLGSLNATKVNGLAYGGRRKWESPEEGARRQYPQVDLHDGDRIDVGKSELAVRIVNEAPARMAASPAACQICGRDIRAELGSARQGDYICLHCRERARDALDDQMANAYAGIVSRDEFPAVPGLKLECRLGAGGFGAVYLAHDERGRKVAVKFMLSQVAVDPASREMFVREIDVVRKLHHPNIVSIIDYRCSGSLFYFVMDYADGGSLEDLFQYCGGRMSAGEVMPLMLQALEGMAYAHERNFVHRDLKPPNILLSGPASALVARVSDFGLAKSFQNAGLSGMTVTGAAAGSPPFMPREQVTNFKYVKPVSDVWSLAATIYYLLTGSFVRNFRPDCDPIVTILQEPVIPTRKRDASVPRGLADVLDRALDDNPVLRYQTGGEFRDALSRIC